jgi:hypothetical protein
MSQPLLAADLRGFLTSKNGFDLGSRLFPKKKPPTPECGWPFSSVWAAEHDVSPSKIREALAP